MGGGDTTVVYDGIFDSAAIATAISGAAAVGGTLSGENWVVVPNPNQGTVAVIQVEAKG